MSDTPEVSVNEYTVYEPECECGWVGSQVFEESIADAEADAHECRTTCPNCNGSGHEGTGQLDDDYPCRTCRGAKVVASDAQEARDA